jgi:DNA-binding response OmpR family regulator
MTPSIAQPSSTKPVTNRGQEQHRLRHRILLVDDDASVRSSLANALESENYQVMVAASGDEAVEKAEAGELDLVLLDVCLPDGSGWDVVDRITAMSPFMPIIAITARTDQYERAAKAGATALMEKPLYLPQLMLAIQRVLEESATERLRRIVTHRPILLTGPI